jgi:multiple sugar transport system substrate-binding protein
MAPITLSTRRRQLGAAAVLTAGAAALAACGAGGSGEPASQSAQPVTLQWGTDWTSGPRGDATNQSIPAFQAQFPNIKLDMRANSEDVYQAFVANLAAGTLADVMLFAPGTFLTFADQNVFPDIAPQLKKFKFDKESVWWESQYFENNGKTHGMPYQFVVSTWVYNKTWFNREGVAPPTDAWTTDDLLAAARKLSRGADGQWGVQMTPSPNAAWPWLYANGVDLMSYTTPVRTQLDQPKQQEVFQYAVDLIHRQQVAPVLEGKNGVKGLSFEKGNFAMTVNNLPRALVASIGNQFDWDVMPTPRWAGTKKRATNVGHMGHVVTKAAEQRGHVDAAVQFMMWMAGEGGQTIVAKTGGATPVHKKTALSPVYLDGRPPGMRLQLDLLTKKADQDAHGYRLWKTWMPWYNAILPFLQQAFAGDMSVSEMGVKATLAGNAALDAAGK